MAQYSVTEQLRDLIGVSNKMGLCDASDFLLNTVTSVGKNEAAAAAPALVLDDSEERALFRNDLGMAIHLFQHRTGCTVAEAKHIIFALALGMGLIARASVKRFMGGCDEKDLPIKKGMTVTIKKGALIQTIGKEPRPAGKTYKVKVHHIVAGRTQYRGHRGEIIPSQNPTVVWAGPGGYWSSVDVNDLPEAQEQTV